jgi:DNA-binding response OmpR family regulator
MDDTAHMCFASALFVGGYEDERRLVREVFRERGWRLFEAPDRRRATQCLRRHPVQVVIAKSDMPDGSWQEMLDHLRRLARPPLLIVTSRTADEHLWAEVLNIGGYDVLAQPFERDEMVRVVESACRHFGRQPVHAGAQQTDLVASVA